MLLDKLDLEKFHQTIVAWQLCWSQREFKVMWKAEWTFADDSHFNWMLSATKK